MANTVNKVLTIAEVEVGYLEKSSTTNLDSKENGASDGNYTKYWRDLKKINAIPQIYISTDEIYAELKSKIKETKYVGGK